MNIEKIFGPLASAVAAASGEPWTLATIVVIVAIVMLPKILDSIFNGLPKIINYRKGNERVPDKDKIPLSDPGE